LKDGSQLVADLEGHMVVVALLAFPPSVEIAYAGLSSLIKALFP
jgi:hypothetical protein